MQTITTGAARANGALRLPVDVAAYLKRHGLELGDILTDSNPKLNKGAAIARAVIHHTLPGRALAAAINSGNGATVPPRAYLPTLAARCEALGLTEKARRHNACPWATVGCSDACLAWAGHGGLSQDVAACRGRRTLAMIDQPETYGRAMVWAIARQWQRAQADGLPLACRLRGTDDQPWHLLRVSVTLAEAVTIRRRFGLLIANGKDQTIAQILAPAVAEAASNCTNTARRQRMGRSALRRNGPRGGMSPHPWPAIVPRPRVMPWPQSRPGSALLCPLPLLRARLSRPTSRSATGADRSPCRRLMEMPRIIAGPTLMASL
jgi:hypothetical protein